jgi:hypothetical protein
MISLFEIRNSIKIMEKINIKTHKMNIIIEIIIKVIMGIIKVIILVMMIL